MPFNFQGQLQEGFCLVLFIYSQNIFINYNDDHVKGRNGITHYSIHPELSTISHIVGRRVMRKTKCTFSAGTIKLTEN